MRQHLVALTLPMVWGILSTILLNLAETYFVGKLGTNELAALSFTFPVTFVLISLAIGLGAGTSSVIARAIGEGDRARVRRLTSDSLVLSFLAVCLMSLVGIATIDPLFRLLKAPEDILPDIRGYMQIAYAGVVFLVGPMVGMSAVRAAGDAKLPGMIMIATAVVNVALDPLLIFGVAGIPALGLRGAALAAVIARALSFCATLAVLHYDKHMLSFRRAPWPTLWRSWRALLHVGIPAAATNMIIPISVSVVTRLVAHYGKAPVAAFGVASRIEAVALVPFYAMSSIMGPFVGQNLGAGRIDRIGEAMRTSFRFCLLFGCGVAAILALLGPFLTRRFDDTPAVVATAASYMRIMPLSYGLAGVVMIVNAAFNGIGRPAPAVIISITRMVLIYIPLAYLGSTLLGVPGIFAGGSLANIAVGFGSYLYIQRHLRSGAFGTARLPSAKGSATVS